MTTQDAPWAQGRWQHDDAGTTADSVVAGYDGSASSVEALMWAAAAAAVRGVRLRVLCVADLGDEAGAAVLGRNSHSATHRLFQIEQEAAEKLADEAVRQATQVEGGLLDRSVVPEAVLGNPTAALIEASRGAGLLVLGHRDLDELTGAMLESVALAVTAAATCPVVVVRADAARRPDPGLPVVVGIDDSRSMVQALTFAGDIASRTGAPLVVLAAWTSSEVHAHGEATGRAGEAAQTVVEAALEQLRSTHRDITVTARVVEDDPAAALLSASEGAGLVVVGAQHEQDQSETFHGSVRHAAIHRSQCPVAVVRGAPPA